MQFHTTPGQAMPASNPQGNQYNVDAGVMRKKVNIKMLAASKMVTRDKLMQIVPFWMQTLSQGNLMQSLNQTGQTIDFNELFRMLQDATGVSHLYQLVRPMTQQEQQAKQQEQQQAQQADQQKQQAEGQTRKDIMQMKVQGDLQKEQIKKQPSPWEQYAQQAQAQQDAAKAQQEMQMEAQAKQQDLQVKQMLAAIDMHSKRQQAQMDLAKKSAEVQIAAQKNQGEREHMQATHQIKMAQLMQQMQADQAQAANQQQIADKFPASQGSEPGSESATNEKRPLREHGSPKHKAKPPQ